MFKKILFIIMIFSANLFAFVNNYYATLEPIETYNIKSNVSGKVLFINRKLEATVAHNEILVHIDDEIDKKQLRYLNQKINIINNMLNIETDNYNAIKNLATKSKLEKDNSKLKILNVKSTLNDLLTKKLTLENTIANKTIKSPNTYIYKFLVNKGDFVNFGSPLFIAKKINQGKLTIYLSNDELKNIKNKIIYINDKPTKLTISKIFAIADEQKISSYKCEIVVNQPLKLAKFSQLLKINFKDIKQQE